MRNLRAAWENVAQNGGAGGIDGITIRRWRMDWETRLTELRQSVLGNTYKPLPLRRFKIRKADGNFRHFGIPTVTDRVLQRAILQALDDYFETIFLPSSYGYRVGRGVRDAVRRTAELRDEGFSWVLDADIDECFQNIDHALLIMFLEEHVRDFLVLRLIRQWLAVMPESDRDQKGPALGGVISPLLCNIYLHRLDEALSAGGWNSLVRYADDFCVFCLTETDARRAYDKTARILADLKMTFEPHKTQITNFERGFDYLGVHFEGDEFSFISANKRVRVKRPAKDMPLGWLPEGYEQWERSTS